MNQHTMINYIKDQPRALQATFEKKNEFCEMMISLFQQNAIKKVYLVGSGTSFHASMAIKQYFEEFINVEATVCIPTVFTNYEKLNNNGIYKNNEILVIAISQSGTSLSTIHALQRANNEGCITVALTENLDSLITKETNHVVHLTCGKELIPIETRGYTVTVLTGLLWAIEIANALHLISNSLYQEKLKDIQLSINQLPQVLESSEQWYETNKVDLLQMQKGAIAGYGINYVTALEATLKLYETYHKPISGFELEEMIHGFEMAFDQNQFIFMIASDGKELSRIPIFRDFLGDLTSHIYVFTCEDIAIEKHDLILPIKCMNEMTPITYIIPFQILAARNCENIGYDTSKYPHQRRSFSHKRD